MDALEEGGRKHGYETRMDPLLEEVYEQENGLPQCRRINEGEDAQFEIFWWNFQIQG